MREATREAAEAAIDVLLQERREFPPSATRRRCAIRRWWKTWSARPTPSCAP